MRALTLSLSEESLAFYVQKQINVFFPDDNFIESSSIKDYTTIALERLRICFENISIGYYIKDNKSYFNHLHGDHYSMFLYMLSNTAYLNADVGLASKIFLLNKMLFGIDVFYEIELPKHFLFVHPIGTVLGRAIYGDYFITYQGVTVGATTDGNYPTFSKGTILYSGSSIIGQCKTGKNFILAAKASLLNTDVDDNKVILGAFPQHKIIENRNNLIKKYFNV